MNAQPNLGIEVTTFENPMGVDGFEFIGRIRHWEKERAVPAVPVVALTAYADERNRQRMMESDFQKCLTKPVETDQLLSVLARLAHHHN